MIFDAAAKAFKERGVFPENHAFIGVICPKSAVRQRFLGIRSDRRNCMRLQIESNWITVQTQSSDIEARIEVTSAIADKFRLFSEKNMFVNLHRP